MYIVYHAGIVQIKENRQTETNELKLKPKTKITRPEVSEADPQRNKK